MGSFALLPVAARRLQGKVALITGGASGIGERTARLFCRHGAKVVIADVQDDKAMSVVNDIGPGMASFVHCNVAEESDVRAAVDAAVATHGKLDVMYNNAGVSGDPNPSILESDKSNFDRVMGVNVTGPFLGTKHAARAMVPARSGSIIITASVASVIGGDVPYPYTCSKHALVGLAKAAAGELGRYGIRVNCVSPYVVATAMAVEGLGARTGEELEEMAEGLANLKGVGLKAEDVANTVLYLASDEGKYVSGQNLLVDGGYAFVKKSST